MKKLGMMVAVMMMVMSGIAAPQIYDVKMFCKEPVVKGSDASGYYQETVSLVYYGWTAIEIGEDGNPIEDSPVFVYSRQGKECTGKTMVMNFSCLNIYGKNLKKTECLATCTDGVNTYQFCGQGNCEQIIISQGSCGEAPVSRSYLKNISCDVSGTCSELVQDPCGNTGCFLLGSTCLDSLVAAEASTLKGTATLRFNKSLSEKALTLEFFDVIVDRIPKNCVYTK